MRRRRLTSLPSIAVGSALVTHVTGDQVQVSTPPDGRQGAAVVRERAGVGYRIGVVDGHTHVVRAYALR